MTSANVSLNNTIKQNGDQALFIICVLWIYCQSEEHTVCPLVETLVVFLLHTTTAQYYRWVGDTQVLFQTKFIKSKKISRTVAHVLESTRSHSLSSTTLCRVKIKSVFFLPYSCNACIMCIMHVRFAINYPHAASKSSALHGGKHLAPGQTRIHRNITGLSIKQHSLTGLP